MFFRLHFLPFLLVLLALVLASGCNYAKAGTGVDFQAGKLKIVATIFPLYDFARAVAGGNSDITLLIKPGQSIHSFDPSVADIQSINNCDLFIYIGGKSDAWAEKLLSAVAPQNKLRLTDYVDLLEIPGHDGEHDEHIWTSPANAKAIVMAIADALDSLDALAPLAVDAADAAKAYISQLEALEEHTRGIISAAPRGKIIVADAFTMLYFTEHYGLAYQAALAACADHGDISAAAVMRLINAVRDEGVGYIYHGEAGVPPAAGVVAGETGAELLLLHSAQNLSPAEFTGGATYLSLMWANAENLARGLSK